MSRSFVLEICLDSAESALTAQKAGADRVELCANLAEGGTTPSIGLIKTTRGCLQIPLQVMIRPRGGDFCYSEIEFEVMQADILAAKQAGVNGVVLGILKPDGTVDVARTKVLVDLARPMNVTFHRAFDLTPDPLKAMEDIIAAGADKILTSGQARTAIEGIPLLSKLVQQAEDWIVIMPGAGINEFNIDQLLQATNATEVHMSANGLIPGQMKYQPDHIPLGSNLQKSEYDLSRTDYNKVSRIKQMDID